MNTTKQKNQYRILIVEDESIIGLDLVSLLKKLGYTVCDSVTTGNDAISAAERQQPDLILMDIELDGLMDGIEAAQIIRRQFDIPVIFVTAHADETRLERAKQVMPFGFILKPYNKRNLKVTLEMALYAANLEKERQRSDRELKASEERFRMVTELISDFVYYNMLIPDGGIQTKWMAGAVESITGYTPGELMSADSGLDIVVHPNDLKAVREKKERLFDNQAVVCEYRCVNKNGQIRWLRDHTKPVRDPENGRIKGILGAVQDVTDRKLADDANKLLENRLRQSQKLEAIGTLAGGIAHEFNNILAAIMGYTELSLVDCPSDYPIKTNLDRIMKASQRAKNLVQQILSFSRPTEQVKRPVQIAPLLRETVNLLRATIPSNIEIKEDVGYGTGLIKADPFQIQEVLMNLASNAAHAMASTGGVLEIKLEDIVVDRQSAGRHPGLEPGAYLKLSVNDNGYGMEQNILDRIFEPFFTTKDTGEGMGMGLSIVHGIVKSHGGSVEVYSVPGKGSSFEVFLPMLRPQDNGAAKIDHFKLPGGTESVLFIDDEASLVDIGHKVLTRLGYQVRTSTSSLEALDMFSAEPQAFDLVITDQTMPHLTGLDLAARILQVRPDLPIILCTGYSQQVTPEKARERGIKCLLQKPLIIREVAQTVREVLDRAG